MAEIATIVGDATCEVQDDLTRVVEARGIVIDLGRAAAIRAGRIEVVAQLRRRTLDLPEECSQCWRVFEVLIHADLLREGDRIVLTVADVTDQTVDLELSGHLEAQVVAGRQRAPAGVMPAEEAGEVEVVETDV